MTTPTIAPPYQVAPRLPSAVAVPFLIPPDPTPVAPLVLRDYQAQAVQHVLTAIHAGDRAFYITLPTGTGKAVILAQIAQALRSDGRVLVLVHTKELVRQLADQLRRVCGDNAVGIVMNTHDDPSRRIVVGCVATLRTASRLVRVIGASDLPFTAILIDEAHHATATSAYATIAATVRSHSPGAALLGCTATPYRNDKQRMQDLLPRCVFARDVSDMQSAGWLAPLQWQRLPLDLDLSTIRTSRAGGDLDYDAGVLAVTLNSPTLNDHIAQRSAPLLTGRRVVVFAADVAHARALAAAYEAAGITSATIWGDMPPADRDRTLARWRAGEIQAVTNCNVLTEGFDYPAIDAIVMARPTQSLARYMQCIGRGTRLAPGKQECLVIDCVGNEDITDARQIVLPDIMPLTASDAVSAGEPHAAGLPRAVNERCVYLIDPRHDAQYLWQRHEGSGCYFLRLDEHRIAAITGDPTGSGLYRVALIVRSAATPGAVPTTRAMWLIPDSAPLHEIREQAATWIAQHARIWISQKDRHWRHNAATEKQLATLANFAPKAHALAVADGWDRGQVAAALDLAVFGRYNVPAIHHLWKEAHA